MSNDNSIKWKIWQTGILGYVIIRKNKNHVKY